MTLQFSQPQLAFGSLRPYNSISYGQTLVAPSAQLQSQPLWAPSAPSSLQVSNGGTRVAPSPSGAPKSLVLKKGEDFHEHAQNENSDGLRLISLGSYCGPKLTFRALGRDEATLPFDWIRTRLEGLLHYLKNDFDGFFNYVTKEAVPGCGVDKPMVMHRDYYHSFWHDDLSEEATFEKYRRRFERIKEIDATSSPVLFVRTVVTTDEMDQIGELYSYLQQRFGRYSKLLIIVDFQEKDEPVLFQDRENLILYKLHHAAHDGSNHGAPYKTPIATAIQWAKSGHLPGATLVPSLSSARISPTHWGLMGLGGLNAFETTKESKAFQSPAPSSNRFAGAAATESLRASMASSSGPVSLPSSRFPSTALSGDHGRLGPARSPSPSRQFASQAYPSQTLRPAFPAYGLEFPSGIPYGKPPPVPSRAPLVVESIGATFGEQVLGLQRKPSYKAFDNLCGGIPPVMASRQTSSCDPGAVFGSRLFSSPYVQTADFRTGSQRFVVPAPVLGTATIPMRARA